MNRAKNQREIELFLIYENYNNYCYYYYNYYNYLIRFNPYIMPRDHNYTKENTDTFRKNEGDIFMKILVNFKMTFCEHALALAISLCQNV